MRNQGEESPRFKEGLNDERLSPVYSRLKNIKSLHVVESNFTTEKKDNKDIQISKILEENVILEKKYIQSQIYLKESIEKYEKLLHTNMALKETIFKLQDENHQARSSPSLVIENNVFLINILPKPKTFKIPSSPKNIKDTTNQLAEVFINMKNKVKELEQQNKELVSRLIINEENKKLEAEQKKEAVLKIDMKFEHSKLSISQQNSFIDSPNDRSLIKIEQDMVDLHQEKKKLKKDNEKYIKKIVALQNEIAFKDEELKNYKTDLAENKEICDKLQQHCSRLENEFLKTKGKITEALNAAFESGKTDMVEFIEKDILSVERRSLIATKLEIK